MRDLGYSKSEHLRTAESGPPEDLESCRRRVRELEQILAERDLQEIEGRKEVSCLAKAFQPAKIRAWYWTAEARQTQYLPIRGEVRDAQGRPAGQVSLSEERLLHAIHPDDRERLASIWDRAYEEHMPYDIEYRLVLTDGEVRHNHEIGTPEFDESGQYLAHFGTTQDITDRKRAEEALREARDELELRVEERTRDIEKTNETLKRKIAESNLLEKALRASEARFAGILDIAPQAVVSVDEGQCIQLFNQGAEAIFGYPATEVLGKPLEMLLPVRFRHNHQEHVKAFAGDPAISHLKGARTNLFGLRKDGAEFPAAASISKLTQDGETIFTVMLHDITDQKRNELELITAKEQAEAANLTKSEFLANMSHEIRTPLNGVIGMANVLQRDNTLSTKQAQHVDVVLECSETLLKLLNDILDLSKIEAGQLEQEEVDFDLVELVDKLALVWRTLTEIRGIELVVDMSQVDVSLLSGPVSRLRQVLINIVGNAIKFTEQGRVTITAEQTTAHNASIETTFTVEDTGIGIADGQLDTIFDKFKQADASTTRQFGGTGLGLAICKRLVDTLDGDIHVESRPGEGSTFAFSVRMCAAAEPAKTQENEEPTSRAAELQVLSRAPLSILAAEDNRANQMVLRTILEEVYGQGGLKLDIVENGLAVMGSLMRTHYDLILMDIQMPELDGLETTARIRNLPGSISGIPIIAVTANAMKGDREKYLAANMDAYVEKPFDIAFLIDTIEQHRPDVAETGARMNAGLTA